jgi:hypothetical protein
LHRRAPFLALSIQQSAFSPEIFTAKDAKLAKKKESNLSYIPLRLFALFASFAVHVLADC